MASAQNFRSAFNGFNREDVVRYLEYLNTKHQNQINQLTAEAEELRAQLAQQPAEDQVEELEVVNNLENPELGSRKVPFGKVLYM